MTEVNSNKKNRRLRLLEIGLFSAGFLLLGVFLVSKAYSEKQSAQPLEAFEQHIARSAVGTDSGEEVHDTSLWSVTRIKEYEDALGE